MLYHCEVRRRRHKGISTVRHWQMGYRDRDVIRPTGRTAPRAKARLIPSVNFRPRGSRCAATAAHRSLAGEAVEANHVYASRSSACAHSGKRIILFGAARSRAKHARRVSHVDVFRVDAKPC